VSSNSTFKTQNSKLQKLTGLLLDWFAQNARDLPWRRTRDPYAIWVSEIMLQQTQVKTVLPYWEQWMRELPTIKAAAKASPDKIHKLWEGLGYYTRARNLQKAANRIMEKYGGTFPQNFDDVLALPGIGRYTAGAICSIAFNQPTPILDGNVIRVLTRVFDIGENPREKETNALLWRLAEELVGRAVPSLPWRGGDTAPYHSFLNQSLMELGALVCTPRNPQCQICPLKKLCVAFREGRIGELPNPGKREAATARRFVAFVVERNGRFLVRQRPVGVVNAHLWEFLNVEIHPSPSRSPAKWDQSAHHSRKKSQSRLTSAATVQEPDWKIIRAAKSLGIATPVLQPLCTVKHSITRYRITLEAFHVHLGGTSYTSPYPKGVKSGTRKTRPSENNGVWQTPAQLRKFAFTAAHKTILNKLQSPADDVCSSRLRRVVSGVTPETIGKHELPPFAQSPTT
jgi:A/G-specific adenine glycosylase